MGREAEAQIRLAGTTGAGRVVLEADALILRGEVRAHLPRAGLSGWRVDGEDLHLTTSHGPLTLTLGAKEAAAWVRALDKPPPTLAEKLGATTGVCVAGAIFDPDLAAAIAPYRMEAGSLVVAEVQSADDLATAMAMAGTRSVWVCTIKGRASPFNDNAARTVMRDAGWIDTKSCAVSATLTGTRYKCRA